MQSFGHVFYGHTRKNLNDGHIWFSIFARPAGSRFTRMQRAACCMMLLWMEMLVNIMWYKVIPPAPAQSALNIGPFSLSPAQVCYIIILKHSAHTNVTRTRLISVLAFLS